MGVVVGTERLQEWAVGRSDGALASGHIVWQSAGTKSESLVGAVLECADRAHRSSDQSAPGECHGVGVSCGSMWVFVGHCGEEVVADDLGQEVAWHLGSRIVEHRDLWRSDNGHAVSGCAGDHSEHVESGGHVVQQDEEAVIVEFYAFWFSFSFWWSSNEDVSVVIRWCYQCFLSLFLFFYSCGWTQDKKRSWSLQFNKQEQKTRNNTSFSAHVSILSLIRLTHW